MEFSHQEGFFVTLHSTFIQDFQWITCYSKCSFERCAVIYHYKINKYQIWKSCLARNISQWFGMWHRQQELLLRIVLYHTWHLRNSDSQYSRRGHLDTTGRHTIQQRNYQSVKRIKFTILSSLLVGKIIVSACLDPSFDIFPHTRPEKSDFKAVQSLILSHMTTGGWCMISGEYITTQRGWDDDAEKLRGGCQCFP